MIDTVPLVAGRMPDESLYWYDERAADHAVSFFADYLEHLDGEFVGQPFKLLPWQEHEIVRPLFGWKHLGPEHEARELGIPFDGLPDRRMIRRVYVEVPKKNGKSALCSGLGLLLLSDDNEARSQVFCVAADTMQARIVHDASKQMALRSPVLSRFIKPYQFSLVDTRDRGSFRVLSADADTKHGLNIHGLIIDELHVVGRELYDTLVQGVASRRQPVVFTITTAGYDRESICWELHEKALGVLDGTLKDDAFLPVVYAADLEQERWDDIETAKRCNPSFGVTVKEDFFRQEIAEAKARPSHETTYKWLHLNVWTESHSQWISLDAWDECRDDYDGASLAGNLCYGGLDLGAVSDLSAYVLGFPEGEKQVRLLCWAWCPEERLYAPDNKYRNQYQIWAREGWLDTTPGNVTDYSFIKARILETCEQYNVGDIAYDRLFQANQLALELDDEGVTMAPTGQGFASMASPTREFEERVRLAQIRHNGNPVLRWALDNTVVRLDPAGNMKPDKKESQGKIDPVVAAIMALDRVVRHENGPSRYEDEGLFFV